MSNITLVSRVGERFVIPAVAILGSPLAKGFVKNGMIRTCYSNKVLGIVIEYCTRKTKVNEGDDSGEKFGAEILDTFKDDDDDELGDIAFASSYFNLEDLYVLACGALAEKRGVNPEILQRNLRIADFMMKKKLWAESENQASKEDSSSNEEEVERTPTMFEDTPKREEDLCFEQEEEEVLQVGYRNWNGLLSSTPGQDRKIQTQLFIYLFIVLISLILESGLHGNGYRDKYQYVKYKILKIYNTWYI